MPAPPRPDPPDQTARVTIFGRYPPTTWSNVFWFEVENDGAVALADLDSLLDGICTAYAENFAPVMNANVEILGGQLVFWDSSGERVVDNDVNAIGTNEGEIALPANIAVGISWKTAQHYRGGHPRTYLIGATQDMLADVTRLTLGSASLYQAAAAGFRADVNALSPGGTILDNTLVCMSFVRNEAWRVPPVRIPINGESVDSRIDTQRRRLGRDVPA